MLKVNVKDGNIEKALKKFKRKFNETKMISEIREREEYKKPSVLKRQEKKKAIYKEQYNNSLKEKI
ncbi:MAG: 30S ribosomal protein S21 [Nanoarchaeota archaeon]